MSRKANLSKNDQVRIGQGLLGIAVWMMCMPALAQGEDRLVEMINAFRESPGKCGGEELPPAGTLAPDPALAKVKLSPGGNLQQALKGAGFQAEIAEAISVSGPATPTAAMAAIKDRYCKSLLRPEYAAIGASRNERVWRIVLAKPLLALDLGDAFKAGRVVLALVNDARSESRMCGKKRFPAAPPVSWNEKLAQTALAHSTDMANRNYFSHQAKDGSSVGARAQRNGYRWRNIGENLAAGQGSAQQAVSGWLSSPGHCANLMNRSFKEMGAAYALNRKSDMSIYWTQVFGTAR